MPSKNINVIYYILNEFLLLECMKYLWPRITKTCVNIVTGNEPNKTVNYEEKIGPIWTLFLHINFAA